MQSRQRDADDGTEQTKGRVRLVGAGPGAPDLITVRGRRALEEADVVLYDRLVHPDLLDDLDAELVYVGKRKGEKRMTQGRINLLLVEIAREGKDVVRLKGGDPTVFGRGSEEMLFVRERGIDCQLIPGLTSATAAAAHAEIPVTHRGWSGGFTVVTAHRASERHECAIPPFHPQRTLILLMGVGTVEQWRARLLELGYPEQLPVAFIQRASWEDERTVVSSVDDCVLAARDAGIRPPTTAVVGDVVAIRSALESIDREPKTVVPRPVEIEATEEHES